MAEVTLKHVRHPAYASTVATSLTIVGPSPDGLIHLTFFRDLLIPTEERFLREERSLDGGAVEVKMTALGDGKMEHVREDVATIQIAPHVFQNFAAAVAKMQAGLSATDILVQGMKGDAN